MHTITRTRQSRWMVFINAPYVSESNDIPSGWSFMKSKSFNVGEDFALSALDALRLNVEPCTKKYDTVLNL